MRSGADSPNFNFFNMGHQKMVKYGANMGHSTKYGAKYGAVMHCFVMHCFGGHIDFLVDEQKMN